MAEGKKAAVADLAADLGPAMALTGAASENSGADLFAALDVEVSQFDGSAVAPPKRRAGRPPGSVNRSTLKLQGYLQSRGYRDPAEFLASIVSADPRELAARLAGVKDVRLMTFDQALEVLKLQRNAADALMPYFHQKMPIAVHHQGDGAARPLIIIGDGPRGGGARDGSAMSIYDVEDFQRVGDGGAEGSHGNGSHDDA
jgi:hypothetical protein